MFSLLASTYTSFLATIDNNLEQFPRHQLMLYTAAATLATYWLMKKSYSSYQYMKHTNRQSFQQSVYNRLRTLPFAHKFIDKLLYQETIKVIEDFYQEAVQAAELWQGPSRLPKQGIAIEKLRDQFQAVLRPMPAIVQEIHKVSGNIYTLYSEEFISFLGVLMARTALLNPMHNNTAAIMARMEANIIEICRNLFHAQSTYGGSINHGGSTSIFEALKAYTFYARDVKKIDKPNIIVPSTIHVAFYKAAEILNINIITVPADSKTGKADVISMEQKINSNTIAIVGSAPSFMAGIIDPIQELGEIALKHNIGLHVDSCLGGFLTAFTEQAGYDIGETCDFRVPGVTSISADLHKYGATIKGTSILLLGNMHYKSLGVDKYFSLADSQAQAYADWPGGFYVTKTVDGSRSLLPIAACLATLLFLGQDYYVDTTKNIISVKDKILDLIEKDSISNQNSVFKYIRIIGAPKLSIIAFISNSDKINIHQIASRMNKYHKWDLNLLQNPDSFHLCLTAASLTNPNTAKDFFENIKESINYCLSNPAQKASGMAELYCSKAKIPAFANIIMETMAKAFVHIIYSWWPNEEKQQMDSRYNPYRLR